MIPVIGLYELTTTIKMNMMADRATPIIHANFFCFAPTYSGDWLYTINRPIINVGENLGLTNTRMMKSARNRVITYLNGKKLFLNTMNIKEVNVAKNSMPADALISLSFKTGMLYSFTFSPNCISLFIFLFFIAGIWVFLYKITYLKKAVKGAADKQWLIVNEQRMQVNHGIIADRDIYRLRSG